MAPPNTTIIFCSGAWHTETHIRPAVPSLEKAGYHVIPHPLTTANSHGKGSWELDVTAVETAATKELDRGQNVALILHSAGGPPGCKAVDNILSTRQGDQPGKLVKIIFVASFIVDDERDAVTAHLFKIGSLRMGTGAEEGTIFAENGHQTMFNDMSAEAAAPYVEALTGQTAYAALGFSDKWKEVSSTYMLCERDNAAPPAVQKWIAEKEGLEVKRIDASHDPFISQPEEFARLVDEIISA